MAAKTRIDRLLVDRGLVESRERAQAVILAGRVFVRGQRVDKAGTAVPDDADIDVRGDPNPYVSRGGSKLAGVIGPLAIDPTGRVCIDIGASTGGFTDVLLQHGAVRVHTVDVGRAQLHEKIRSDPRVHVHEEVNARHGVLDIVRENATLIVIDVSFISLTKILPAAVAALATRTEAGDVEPEIVAMVKPQFELAPSEVGRGGVVRDDALREKAVRAVVDAALALGLRAAGRCESPVHGPAGNREVFVKFVRWAT